MEDFYKKYGFDIVANKAKNRRFHIVRYYPKIQTYEFINVGIILYEDNKIFYKLLHSEETAKLHCSSLIESTVLKNSLDSLDNFLQNEQSINSTLDSISNRYKNILDTSFQLVYSGSEETKELVDKLFYDYIGHKFDMEGKKDTILEFIKTTRSLIIKDYSKYLEVHTSKIKGYTLDFIHKETKDIHHTLLGSIENSENISRAFINVPSTIPIKNEYHFLNVKSKLDLQKINNKIKLDKVGIKFYSYSNNDEMKQYVEKIIS
jgi:hypothetical protein